MLKAYLKQPFQTLMRSCSQSFITTATSSEHFMCESNCISPLGGYFPPAKAAHGVVEIEISVENWDAMFSGVLERLRQAAGEVLAVSSAPGMTDSATRIQTIVLECAGAMEQLHAALKHDRDLQ